jgi:hypothetical protein
MEWHRSQTRMGFLVKHLRHAHNHVDASFMDSHWIQLCKRGDTVVLTCISRAMRSANASWVGH